MNKVLVPQLKANEPVEVAMGGSLVTTYTLVDVPTGRSLSPNSFSKDFLMESPQADFALSLKWNSLRDEVDFSLVALDNKSGKVESLSPIHSVPTEGK